MKTTKKRELTEEDYAELDRLGKLPMTRTPALIRYLAKHGHVAHVIHTPHGTVYECDNYIRQATPEELECRRQNCQQLAARLRDDLIQRRCTTQTKGD